MTNEERKFIDFWSAKRDKKKTLKDYLSGGTIGILIGIGTIISLASGWYQRANMEAGANLNPMILFVCIVAIAVFLGYFHYQYTWDNNEKRYLQIMNKEKKKADSDIHQNQPS